MSSSLSARHEPGETSDSVSDEDVFNSPVAELLAAARDLIFNSLEVTEESIDVPKHLERLADAVDSVLLSEGLSV